MQKRKGRSATLRAGGAITHATNTHKEDAMGKKSSKSTKYDGAKPNPNLRTATKNNPGGMKKAPAGGGKDASGGSKMW